MVWEEKLEFYNPTFGVIEKELGSLAASSNTWTDLDSALYETVISSAKTRGGKTTGTRSAHRPLEVHGRVCEEGWYEHVFTARNGV